jgi:hypothetical protein
MKGVLKMSMNLADALREDSKWTVTENGADAKNTTGNPLLDLYATIGSLRQRDEKEIIMKFILAFNHDKQGAVRCLFYARDIRGGLGERNTFRVIYRYMGDAMPEIVEEYLGLIPEMGRFDDFYALIGTKAEDAMWGYVGEQLSLDQKSMIAGKPCSLLAKWLKKADSKSKDTKALGIYTVKKLGISVYEYKRLCNKLRKYINVVEVKMSENRWTKIEYDKVPSKAMLNYTNAFKRHDEQGFSKYILNVEEGTQKINTSTLYPYDIVHKYLYETGSKELEVMWDNLPDYLNGVECNALVIADTSGSMTWDGGMPISSAVGLAIYFAERNKGAFHNLFMTFSSQSKIHSIDGLKGLAQKINFVKSSDSSWCGSTDLEAAFTRVLYVATQNKVPKEEMPKAFIVISDMEIDRATEDDNEHRQTFYDAMRAKYAVFGYDLPKIIFWNVNSRHDVFHSDDQNDNTLLVSGQSASTFKNIIQCIDKTPVEMMYAVLNSERYSVINIE